MRPALGRLDRPSMVRALRDWRRGFTESLRTRIRDHWREWSRGRSLYDLMNALGYEYAERLVLAHVEPVHQAAAGDAPPDDVAAMAEATAGDLHMAVADVEAVRQARGRPVFDAAIDAVRPSLPESPDALLARALAERNALYYNDFHYDVEGELQQAAGMLEDIVLHHGVPEDVVYHREGADAWWVPEETLRAPVEERRGILRDVLRAANEEARRRTWYGTRRVELPDTPFFTILQWSNAGRWFVAAWPTRSSVRARFMRGVTEIRLDANEILVPYPPWLVEKVVGEIDPLPLFERSLEAREARGPIPATDQEMRKALRSLVDQHHQDMDAEERGLLAMDLFAVGRDARRNEPGAREAFASALMRFGDFPPAFFGLFERWLEGRP